MGSLCSKLCPDAVLWAFQGICGWDRWHLSWPLFWDTLPWRTSVSNKAQLPSDLGEGRIVGCGNGCVGILRISPMPCTASKGERQMSLSFFLLRPSVCNSPSNLNNIDHAEAFSWGSFRWKLSLLACRTWNGTAFQWRPILWVGLIKNLHCSTWHGFINTANVASEHFRMDASFHFAF